MKKFLVILFLASLATGGQAQKVDSIFFHLYTDSLKKGTHNYINVDGKTADGKWLPMTTKDIVFTSSACSFSGNDLVIPADFAEEKITIKARLKDNPSGWIEQTVWIKKKPDPEFLPTKDDVMRDPRGKKRRG